uniref:TGF-beta family profile domain-containing protein n=1 Tax=Timema tahoe TaxID=61484 RepID=A0A7R9NWM0_9NEOP|nr:unnamed protein product [Timema tahoe]
MARYSWPPDCRQCPIFTLGYSLVFFMNTLRERWKDSYAVLISSAAQPFQNPSTKPVIVIPDVSCELILENLTRSAAQLFASPSQDNVRCAPAAQNPSACFLFQLPVELEPDDLTTVELWIYKERDRLDQHNQTFVVSEVAHWDINHSTQKTKLLTIKDTDVKEGWVKIDMAWVVKNWLEYQELFHAIFIECKSCGMEVARSPISLQPDRKPFLIIRTSSVNKRRRAKRHVNCVPGVSECCRENLYISFAEIGWDDWILHPTGYQAYFCRGSCSNAASLTVSGSHYNSIIRKLLYQGRPNNKRIDLVPCCTATHLSSIQLLYMDNNQALTQKTLPNMVVDSCGCM